MRNARVRNILSLFGVGMALSTNMFDVLPTKVKDTPLRRAKKKARYREKVGYKPHQGARECSRRIRSRLADGSVMPSVPRRLWSLDHKIGGVSSLRDIAPAYRQFATLE